MLSNYCGAPPCFFTDWQVHLMIIFLVAAITAATGNQWQSFFYVLVAIEGSFGYDQLMAFTTLYFTVILLTHLVRAGTGRSGSG